MTRCPPTRKKRRAFLLIEVELALCLVVLCFFPLIFPYSKIQKEKMHEMRTLQIEQFAPDALSLLKTDLAQGDLGTLLFLKKGTEGTLAKEYTLHMPGKKILPTQCHYRLEPDKNFTKEATKTRYLLLNVILTFAPLQTTTTSTSSYLLLLTERYT